MPDEAAARFAGSNVPEFSVGDLAHALKRTLEENFGRVRVRGELSRVSIASSGHMYSSLKDENAVLDAVCWKGTLSKLGIKPAEGLEVICTGRITTYVNSSKYQLVIESMELAGQGALLKMLEDRKKKLAAEGLFAAERKKPIPVLPGIIGVITSPTGAVIRDILHRLEERFPRHVLVWPVLVQGQGAAEQIASAINGFQTLNNHGLPRPNLLIVARGGGSLEDLMAFNEETVVRAVAASHIPVISAVGHETDTTLCDFAADLRAPTPTAAAELAVPVRAQLRAQIQDDGLRLSAAIERSITQHKTRIEAAKARLGDPSRILEGRVQKIDHLSDKLSNIFTLFLQKKRHAMTRLNLPHPQGKIENAAHKLERWRENLTACRLKITQERSIMLQHTGKLLEAFSFKNILDRGFAVVRSQNGRILTDAAQLGTNMPVEIEFREQKRVKALTLGDN